MQPVVLLLSSDLMCSSQLQGAAQRGGWTLECCTSADALLNISATAPPTVVLLDLNTPGLEPLTLVPRLRSGSSPPKAVLAFGPHVHEKRLADARAAGCEGVFARGQFYAQAAEIVGRYLSP